MQAIILAAGMGKRLKELTNNNPKCMVKVNGVTLIERMLTQLDALNLHKVTVVVGYKGDMLMEYINSLNLNTKVEFIVNDVYDKTNNIYSLYLAKDVLKNDDTLLLESDLIFDNGLLEDLIADKLDNIALVDKYESWMDGTCVTLSDNNEIDKFIPGSKFVFEDSSKYYKTVNIYKFSKHFSTTHYVPFLEAYSNALGNNEYYEQVLRVITMLDDSELKAKLVNNKCWYEIDDVQDLDIAESMFTMNASDKYKKITNRYGGFWRYPKLIDFCYLVNPYYPPARLMDEIKANFNTLLTQYPSGQYVNSLLAGKYFGVHTDNIVVGNGAAELIKVLAEYIDGKVGIIRPTFEEYPNRLDSKNVIEFIPSNDDFSYDTDDIINAFNNKSISTLILINPDNPTGNYIKHGDICRLVEWCERNAIVLIIDESFSDFAVDDVTTCIDMEFMNIHKSVVIVKSISKSHGVPGARLGVVASGNEQLIAVLKKDVSIWNICSFGEYYLQIAEKYVKDYKVALEKLKCERRNVITKLRKIDNIVVYNSDANYIMIELLSMKSSDAVKLLLNEYNIIVKDLTSKLCKDNRQFIRVAIKKMDENEKFINAMEEICNT